MREMYRPLPARLGAIGVLVFAGWWALAASIDGDWAQLWRVGPWLGLAGWVSLAVFWWPAVLVDDAGVELRNVLRRVRVPWAALAGVDTRFALTLLTADGRYQSWAAAAPGRSAALSRRRGGADPGEGQTIRAGDDPGEGQTLRASRDLRGDSGAAAFLVEHRWQVWQETAAANARSAPVAQADQPAAPSVGWNRGPLLGALGWLVLAVLSALTS